MSAKPFLTLMAIGDAYGMKYEFVEHEQNADRSDLFYGSHPKFTAYRQGGYTDDTQMSLANSELLVAYASRLSDLSEDVFISAWIEDFQRDPHEGYSKHMWAVLSTVDGPDGFRALIDPKQGTTSGAAMRAAPFGLLPDVEEVKRLTLLHSRITHDTPAGLNAALAVALAVHFLHHGGVRESLSGFLERHLGPDWSENGREETPNNGLKIVMQAFAALHGSAALSQVLLKVVNNDALSDTDTICAMAMVMASRCSDIADDLPTGLRETLENRAFGRDYLTRVDESLERLFPPTHKYAAELAVSVSRKAKLSL